MTVSQTQLQELKRKILELQDALSLESMKLIASELEGEMQATDFWSDPIKAAAKQKRLAMLRETITTWEALLHDCVELEELAAASGDEKFVQELERALADLVKRFEKLEFRTLLSDRHDVSNALVAIHAGTGGVDAMDWAEMLTRMYLRFCEQMGWKVRIIDKLHGTEAGVKSVTFEVSGSYAYGYLKSENGVHRLVRISPFDAEGMRHTSFALVEVIPDLGDVEEVEIKQEDLKIDVFRASGHGGQSVNTTD